MSFDGAIAHTSAWRTNVAIDVAIDVWPHLGEYAFMNDDSGKNRDWLVNKMCALLHTCIGNDPNAMMGCDAVLLARLLIEEQQLDEGRSDGCEGKYGSRFHPSTNSPNSYSETDDNRGTRPLTVGEVSVNWSDGACLRDTLRVKYHIDYKDPIPFIQRKIQAASQMPIQKQNRPEVNSLLVEAILDSNSKVYVLIGHESQVKVVKSTLAQCIDEDDIDDVISSDRFVLVSPKENESHHDMISSIVSNAASGSFIHVIHGSWPTLQKVKILMGDDSPRLNDGFGKCVIDETASRSSLKLSLPSWADTIDEQQLNDATMDPWCQALDESIFLESLSAKISS